MGQMVSSTDYFDSSALVKRYMAESGSAWVQGRCNAPARTIATAELSRVEIAAAFASKLRGQVHHSD
jgi:predicted nucleic acid-binding protein